MLEKLFEEFLVEQFMSWSENIRPGFRYQFKSPDNKNSLRLYQALKAHIKETITVDDGISLLVIPLVHCKVIPILHRETETQKGYTENYISHLRDGIASQNGVFNGCAMIILHNSSLDTLSNSANDLSQTGEVWSPKSIQTSLQGLIDQQAKNRDISNCLLQYQFDIIDDEDATMFGFEPLYKAVLDGDLRFNELQMFEDPIVIGMKGNTNQITKRLEENRGLYEQLSFETEYHLDSLDDRLKQFGEKFITDHFSIPDAWKQVDFETYRNEIKKNRTQKLILEKEELINGELITRGKSATKAGQRDRQLILLLNENQNTIELKISFQGSNIEKSDFKLIPSNSLGGQENIVTRNSIHRSTVQLSGLVTNLPTFFNLALKSENASDRYNFRCVVLRKGDFYISAFQNIFWVETVKKRISLYTDEDQLQLREEPGTVYSLKDTGELIDVLEYSKVDFQELANEAAMIEFDLKAGENRLSFNIEGLIATDSLSLPLLLNADRLVNLFDDEYYGVFSSTKGKVNLDNSEFSVIGVRLQLLRDEERFLNDRIIYLDPSNSLTLEELSKIDNTLYESYKNLFDYLIQRQTLPSLVSWGDEYQKIIMGILEGYEHYLDAIPMDTSLSLQHKQVLKIGFSKVDRRGEKGGEIEEYLSPFHPIILAYYLYLAQQVKADNSKSFASLPLVTLKRLSPRGLLPYVYDPKHDFSYTQQLHENAFWLKLVPQKDTSYDFVNKLVKEKIDEFQIAYKQLFEKNVQSPMIINSVNMGHSEELFIGIVDYFKDQLLKANIIHINLYDEVMEYSAFDRFSETASYDELKTWLGLHKGKVREQADLIIDLLRTRLTYSKFEHSQIKGEQAYAHISFFRNNEKVDIAPVKIDSSISGIACDGLLSGEASKSDAGNYYTGFGLNKVDVETLPHLRIARAVGSLLQPALKSNTPYTGANAIALAVNEDFKGLLEKSYDSAIWTTIIDPKVTLDFFHSQTDIVLIHYTDQYTNSSSYDAITVTKQTELYEKVLAQDYGGKLNEFNAFNGDWLLKMLTCGDKIRKERKGIIGAYKFIACLLKDSDITWLPLSVAEMIRVSGNIGLKMTDSDFSRNVQGYKSGAISDDVLFVGFKDEHLYLLPLEVKTGATPDYNKAIKQTKELLRYLSEDILGQNTLAGKLYRGLFIRQALMQVDKYKLYEVFDKNYFDNLLSEREKWLRGDFKIDSVMEYPQGFVLAHLDSANLTGPEYTLVDGILKVDLPISLLHELIAEPLNLLFHEKDIAQIFHVPSEYLMGKTKTIVSEFDDIEPDIITIDEDDKPDTEIKPQQETHKEYIKSETSLKVLLGHNDVTREALYWEPTNTAKFMNTNTGIIGTMGTGKTQCTKSVVTQLYQNQDHNVDGQPIGILIFDYKSDYVDEKFLNAAGGKKFIIHKLPYNPLSLFGDTPMLPVHTARGFSETMGKAFGLGQKQQLKLRKLVSEAYDLSGISKSDKSTWSRPAPTIADIWSLFEASEPAEDSLYAALESLYELEIFEDNVDNCTSLYELVDGVTVIELARYPSEIQNLVVALTLDLFYSQMQKQGKPEVQGDFRQVSKIILVDEADNFMSQNFASLRKILKEGREYGVGLILSTQDITHFKTSENDYSAYVLTWIIHRVSQIKNQDIKSIFNKDEKSEQEHLMKIIRELEKHHSLYVDGDKNIQKIKDKAFWELLN